MYDKNLNFVAGCCRVLQGEFTEFDSALKCVTRLIFEQDSALPNQIHCGVQFSISSLS